jgi:uncharacterized membrane protein YphA (DoxX/SURF4 family)
MSTQPATLPHPRPVPLPVHPTRTPWRLKGAGALRIAFGIVWAIDAGFKWQPGFTNNVVAYLAGALNGQPPAIQAWITFCLHIVQVNPPLFAHLVAIEETTVALALILGAFTNLASFVGMSMSLIIWSTAEGFGGPYMASSTDIGTAIIYVLVFIGLFLTSAGLYLGVDRRLGPMLGRWSFLASGRI